ncbi:MAG: HU family DNA-binding protein, partial [bacterium]|nr:HU family DNA-binding protein [bacterium]
NLVQAIAKKIGISKRQASECLNVVLDEITKALSKGEEVQLPGFGKFSVTQRKEREVINPKTKEKIKIPAMKAPRFKAGRILKDAVK